MPPSTSTSWHLQGLLAELAARGSAPALITLKGETATSHSAGELADLALRLAAGLEKRGLRPGVPVGLVGPNSFDWIVVRLALGALGALSVAIDDLAPPEVARALLRDGGCRWLFAAPHHGSLADELHKKYSITHYSLSEIDEGSGPSWRRLLAESGIAAKGLPPEAPVALFETSGTTGQGKRFTLSEGNIGANVGALIAEGLIGTQDRVLLPLPLHHAYPLIVGLFTTLGAGAALVLPESAQGGDILRALRHGRVTAIVGVPRLYAALVAAIEGQAAARGRLVRRALGVALRLSGGWRRRFGGNPGRAVFRALRARLGPDLRLLVSGGARLDPEVLWKLTALGWEVRSGYGLAETASIMTGNLPGRERLGSEGRPFQGGEVRIAAPDAEGIGEIQLRGPNVFAGYLDRTAEGVFTDDGWFRSGDLGRLDAAGFLYVTGRLKEVLVLGGGKKVFPEHLEKVYGASPYFAELAVLERGGSLVALVRPDEPAMRAAGNTRVADVVRVTLSDNGRYLPAYERLAGFALVRRPLPRTRLGKFRRFLLPALYEQALHGAEPPPEAAPAEEDRALLAEPLAAKLLAHLEARYPGRIRGLDTSLALDLGIDSLEQVSLSLDLQARFGFAAPDSLLAEATSLRDLLRGALGAERGAAVPSAAADRAAVAPVEGPAAALRWLAYWLNRLLLRGYFRLRIVGGEHLPRQGGFVLVANHVSDLDPPLLAAALPYAAARRLHWSGVAERLFSTPLRRRLARLFNIFPVEERRPGRTLALAGAVLEQGRALAWFPESWRSPDGRLQRFLPGVGRLLGDWPEVPVIPAYIDGAFAAMPRGRNWPRPVRITIRFGPAVRPEELLKEGQEAEEELRIVNALYRHVQQLAEQGGVEMGQGNAPSDPAGGSLATPEEVRVLVGEIEDASLAAILALRPTPAEVEAAVAWSLGESDVMGEARKPLIGKAAEIYDILTADELFEEDRA